MQKFAEGETLKLKGYCSGAPRRYGKPFTAEKKTSESKPPEVVRKLTLQS